MFSPRAIVCIGLSQLLAWGVSFYLIGNFGLGLVFLLVYVVWILACGAALYLALQSGAIVLIAATNISVRKRQMATGQSRETY